MTRITRSNEDRITILDRMIRAFMKTLDHTGQNTVAEEVYDLEVGDTYSFGLLTAQVSRKENNNIYFDIIKH